MADKLCEIKSALRGIPKLPELESRGPAGDIGDVAISDLQWAVAEIERLRGELLNKGIAQCEEALKHLEYHKRLQQELGNLLAIIHRDGGHHTDEVGVEQSVKDAHQVWAEQRTIMDLAIVWRKSFVHGKDIADEAYSVVDEAAEDMLYDAVKKYETTKQEGKNNVTGERSSA